MATTAQVWELYDLYPARIRLAVLLGAFVGLRLEETCGLRPEDIDFMRGVVHPHVQYPAEPLKTKISQTPAPIPAALAAELSAQMAAYGRHSSLLTGVEGRQLSPWAVERAMRTARKKARDLPAGTSGPTVTSPPVPPSRLSSPSGRNRDGTEHSARDSVPAQRPLTGHTS